MTSIVDSELMTHDELCTHPEDYERERLDEIYETVSHYSEMARNERYFLNGTIRFLKPKKILEVGVAQGGGTAIILNAIKDLPHSRLISADYCENFYGGNEKNGLLGKLSGFLVDEKFPQLKDKWTIYRGGDISKFIEQIGNDIDLLVLDTAHIHPWETLNFICILPFMKRNSWVILHDISLPMFKGRENDLACRYLFGHVVSDKKIMPVSDYESSFANIGAFRVTDDTVKYVGNLFESLLNPWAAVPGVFDKKNFPYANSITPEDIESIKYIISKYYPEYVSFLENVIDFQNIIVRHKTEEYMENYGSTAAKLKRYFPLSYFIYKQIKKLMKHQ